MTGIINEKLQSIGIDKIRPHPANPRQGDVGAISESIEANGFYGAIVVQKSTGHILVGNHRWMAAKAAGLDTVPVIYVDVDDERAMRILLADNRTSDISTYDNDALAQLLEHLASTDDGLIGTGYDGDALDEILGDLAEKPIETGAPDQTGMLTSGFQVLVTCSDEWQQGELLERLEAEGYECRALVS